MMHGADIVSEDGSTRAAARDGTHGTTYRTTCDLRSTFAVPPFPCTSLSIIGSPVGQHSPSTSQRLRRELEVAIEGEVRFDKVSRALYSTDASVYQIEPLGVVVPRTRDDIVQTVAISATSSAVR